MSLEWILETVEGGSCRGIATQLCFSTDLGPLPQGLLAIPRSSDVLTTIGKQDGDGVVKT